MMFVSIPHGNDKIVSHKGKQCKFGICRPIGFLNGVLYFLLDLMPDILKMIEDVVYSTMIISKGKIIDPLVT
jgi:hypothetical protein